MPTESWLDTVTSIIGYQCEYYNINDMVTYKIKCKLGIKLDIRNFVSYNVFQLTNTYFLLDSQFVTM
jgi:hypothetical protein